MNLARHSTEREYSEGWEEIGTKYLILEETGDGTVSVNEGFSETHGMGLGGMA